MAHTHTPHILHHPSTHPHLYIHPTLIPSTAYPIPLRAIRVSLATALPNKMPSSNFVCSPKTRMQTRRYLPQYSRLRKPSAAPTPRPRAEQVTRRGQPKKTTPDRPRIRPIWHLLHPSLGGIHGGKQGRHYVRDDFRPVRREEQARGGVARSQTNRWPRKREALEEQRGATKRLYVRGKPSFVLCMPCRSRLASSCDLPAYFIPHCVPLVPHCRNNGGGRMHLLNSG